MTEGIDADTQPDQIRSAMEVAHRALALFGAIGLALRADRGEVLQWLDENDLRRWLTPRETRFVDGLAPSRQDMINMGWQSERLIVLLWSLMAIGQLPRADEQCDTGVFKDILPPFADVSVDDFVSRARLRPEQQLLAMADEMLRLHWEARDAKLNGRSPRLPVDIEIAQERHHAINWVIGYDGLPWDEVTTDT